MASNSLIQPALSTSVAESVYNDVLSRAAKYYYFIGGAQAWNNELSPPIPVESNYYDKTTKRDITLIKEIRASDVSFLINRRDWSANTVYDMYDDRYGEEVIGLDISSGGTNYTANTVVTISGGNGVGATAAATVDLGPGRVTKLTVLNSGYGYNTNPVVTITDLDGFGSGAVANAVIGISNSGANSLVNSNFYVLNSEFSIYKCLDNNGNSPSTVEPILLTDEAFETSDGYIWKYIGTVPASSINKFLSSEFVPITRALSKNYYSRGEIKDLTIMAPGDGYTSATATVRGDGYRESDPYLINGIRVSNIGKNYTTANVFIDSPISYSYTWSAGNVFTSGSRVFSNNNIYQVTLSGVTGISPPIHTVGEALNGNCVFKYLATKATANAIINSSGNISGIALNGMVSRVAITSGGSGYISPPSISFSGGNLLVASGYTVLNGNVVSRVVMTSKGTGYFSKPTVTVGTRWVANSNTKINAQIFNGTNLYTVTNANSTVRIFDAVQDGVSNSVLGLHTNLNGIYFNNTGLKFYTVGTSTTGVIQFFLRKPYDITSRYTYSGNTLSMLDSSPQDVTFSKNGNIMFLAGTTTDRIYRLDLVTPWDPTGGWVYHSNLNVWPAGLSSITANVEPNMTGIYIDETGTRLYLTGTSNDKVLQFNMAVPWDIANAVYISNIFIGGESTPSGVTFTSSGKNMLVSGPGGDRIHQYNLSTPWDLSTATFYNNTLTTYNFGDSNFTGIYYAEGVEKLFICGNDTKTIYQLSLPKSTQLGTTAPSHVTGSQYNGDVVLTYAGTPATATAVLQYGSGYTKRPNVTIYGNGQNAQAYALMTKSEAIITPIVSQGRIAGTFIEDGGIGYTYAEVGISGDGSNAIVIANLSEGDIGSSQGINETLAVDGAIHAIKIISGGYQYSSACVIISGDGTGAAANAIVAGGRVTKITVENPGKNYTFANVSITGSGFGAAARAILPPPGGHGSDIVAELYSRTLGFYSTIAEEKNQGFNVANKLRQVGIIKDVKKFDKVGYFNKNIGSGCYVISGGINESLFSNNSILINDTGARFQIIEKANSSILVNSLDNFDPAVGQNMYLNGVLLFTITGITYPDIDKYSGKVLYVDNRDAFTNSDQLLTLKTVFKY